MNILVESDRTVALTKQGNPCRCAFVWSEAAIHAGPTCDVKLKYFYRRKLIQKGLGKARAAVARKSGDPPVDHVARWH